MSNSKKTGQKLKLRKWVVWVMAILAIIIVGITAYIVSEAVKKEENRNNANVNVNDIELDNVGQIVDNNIDKVEATVEIQLKDTAIEKGTKLIVTAIVTPVNTEQALVWSSSNAGIFEVDTNGIITVKGVGTAVLTATVGNVSDAVVIEGIAKVTDGSSNDLPIYNVSMNTSGTNNSGSSSGSGNTSGDNNGNGNSGTASGGSTSGGNTSGGNTSSGGSTSGDNTSGGNTSSSGSTSGGNSGSSNGGSSSGGNTSGGNANSGGSTSGGNSGSSSGGSSSGGNTFDGNTSGGNTSGGNASSGGSTSGGNSGSSSGGSTSGGNTSGGNTSGGNTSGGSVSIPGKDDGSGYDSTEIGSKLPGVGFDQTVSNLYVYEENGKYFGQIITQPDVTIVYVKERSDTFDATIKSVLAALLPVEHSQVWTNYVTSITDRTFTVENRMVRVVMPSAVHGGHSQIVIYNQTNV
ncbi:MAG: Ig-like domain-containing protein [Lachnospira sp.]|nr:Ig-like domain-containing protein [Lachnospira sp.]